LELSEEEKELIVFGLQMRRNHIETGNALLSAQDAKRMEKEKMIKPLGTDQYRLIVKLEDLITKIRDQK